MKKVISVNSPADITIEKLNQKVRTKVKIEDKLGVTDYYFWGDKISQNTFVWDSARNVNNFLRIKGEIVEKDRENLEIHLKVINKPSYYVIYILAVFFVLIALLSSKYFFAIFAVVFVGVAWIVKYKYFDDVVADIKSIVGVCKE